MKVLRLPKSWKPVATAEKLLDAVIHRASKPNPSYHRPSLGRVIRLTVPAFAIVFHLYWVIPFLALPCIQYLRCPKCIGAGDSHESSSSAYLHNGFKSPLELVEFAGSSIDEVAIAGFLQHTPCLRTLRYSHSTKCYAPQDWNPSQFVTAIERAVGDHLKEFSVSITKDELRGSISPGKILTSGFQQLQKLELPLEIAIRHPSANEIDNLGPLPLLEDLVPASVSCLSFVAQGTSHSAKALDAMFHQFSNKKEFQTPALQRIYLTCNSSADNSYKEQCAKLVAEIEKTGVTLELRGWPSPAWKWGMKERISS